MHIAIPLYFLVSHIRTSRSGETEHSMPLRFHVGIGDQMVEAFAAFSSEELCQTFIDNYPLKPRPKDIRLFICRTPQVALSNLLTLTDQREAAKWIVFNPDPISRQTATPMKLTDAIATLRTQLEDGSGSYS